MKAILTFNLPEDREEFHDVVQAADFKSVLWELDQAMRSDAKYADGGCDTQHWRARLYELLDEYEISLD